MKSLRTSTIIAVAAITTIVLLTASAAADPMAETFNCTWNAGTKSIDYDLAGGASGQTYPVTGIAKGFVVFAGALEDLDGPSDNASIKVKCAAKGKGLTHIDFKHYSTGQVMYSCDYCFSCAAKGADPVQVAMSECDDLPTLTLYGIIGLILFMAITGFWLYRRRRATIAA